MTKLIWMSDTHFLADGDVLGHDPRVRLQAAIDHINDYHSDAQLCVITGDMVNRGSRTDYEGVQVSLANLAIPYLPMVGNHDNRDLFRQVLSLPDNCMASFIQYKVKTPGGLIVCVDTHKIGSDAGEVCQERCAWLKKTLIDSGNTPVFLFMHHPPMPLGLPMQDTENMENGQNFIDLISGFECVKYLFIGHVHRPITGTLGSIPFSTMRSVLYQAPPPRPSWVWDTFKPSTEAPSIGIIQLDGSSIIMQYDQFCQYEVGGKV